MSNLKRLCTMLGMVALTVTFSSCDSTMTEPEATDTSFRGDDLSAAHLEPGVQSCEIISFSSFSHGDPINSLSAFHTTLSVSTVGDGSRSEDQARAYDTSDPVQADPDLEASADCSDCAGLGMVMVISDKDFSKEGDSQSGGTITITGFPSEGETFIDDFKGLDHDGDDGNPIELFIDDTKVGETSAQGDGSVETVDVTDTNISTKAEFVFGGSGAVDDITICHTPPSEGGDEGCTPGYWRQPHHFDSWPEAWTDAEGNPDIAFCSADGSDAVFTCATTIGLDRPEPGDLNDTSLLAALSLRGGGVNALARHAAAAALNAMSEDVEYFYSLSEVQDIVNDALGAQETWDSESAKDELENRNEELCPLD